MQRSEEKIIYYLMWTAIIILAVIGINADDADMILISVIVATALLIYGIINMLRHKRLNMLFNEWSTKQLDEKKNPMTYWGVITVLLILTIVLLIYIFNALS